MPRLTVALQESRAALGRDDDVAARQTTLGLAGLSRDLVATMTR